MKRSLLTGQPLRSGQYEHLSLLHREEGETFSDKRGTTYRVMAAEPVRGRSPQRILVELVSKGEPAVKTSKATIETYASHIASLAGAHRIKITHSVQLTIEPRVATAGSDQGDWSAENGMA
jgi:hypothetical protein